MTSFLFKRSYHGLVQAAIFDWAGTMVDFGCMAPASVFVDVFKKHGVEPTMEQAREPMGMHKKDHIRVMMHMPAIQAAWMQAHGVAPTEADVEALFQEFVPMQLACIAKHADIIPGALDCVANLRSMGMKIGSTTGYNNAMMDILVPAAAKQGYTPDNVVAVTEVPAGRPAPWMALESAKRLGVYPVESIVKIGDTPADIAEGLNAGMWSVGVVDHGNEVGMTQATLEALEANEREARIERASVRLAQAGAHYVVNTIAEVPIVIDEICSRLAAGEKP